MELQNTPNKQSRRNWLRDAAIVTTGVAVMPSLLTNCTDHLPGLGAEPTPADIQLYGVAAENIIRMRQWYDSVYLINNTYNLEVYSYFKSGTPPRKTWIDIVEDIAYNIGIRMLEAAVAEIPGASAAVAIIADQITKWSKGPDTGKKIDSTLADYMDVYNTQYLTVTKRLSSLSSNHDNYKNMREAFAGGGVEFSGKKYTIEDLAQQRFPDMNDVNDVDDFETLKAAAVLKYKRNIWNTMFVLAGEMKFDNPSSFYVNFKSKERDLPRPYAIENYYPNHKARYLRGYYYSTLFGEYFYYASFYFTFDGDELSESAAKVLFKDDAPGHIINPEALFERDYVFKQFHAKKPDFKEYFEIRRDTEIGPCTGVTGCRWFDPDANNYQFTRGDLGDK
ncbi:hypothetical protein [Spirosoma pulveris]